jgi:gliding motility-associated-like protein
MQIIKIHSILLFFCFINTVNAQLTTTPGMSPAALVQNVLLGTGVTVSNIQFTGNAAAISKFTATNTNLGITNGIVMTTGTTYNNGDGPQGPNNKPDGGFDNNAPGNALLGTIANGTTYNAAILKFDFIPFADTVKFRYVFGSEEYPEYAPPQSADYNDVFGFFISGPGIVGQQNIAKLPNGSIVSINNINPVNNSFYYINNGNGNQAPYNGSSNYIQYDGFTKVLEAIAPVQCGKKYQLILSIADVGDGVWDSGIFLEANSLTSKKPIEIDYTISGQSFGNDSTMAEGCVSATFTLSRPASSSSSAVTIPITVSGTAIQGVDYSSIPSSVTFQPGQTAIQFTFNALADVLTEGLESLTLTFGLTDACGNVKPEIFNLGINDIQPVAVTVQSGSVLCPGDDLEVIANATGGVGPYSYLWNTGETTSSIFVSPTSTQTYTVTVVDNCLLQSATGSGTVSVPVYPPLVVQSTADITEICPYIPTDLLGVISGGAGNYSYQWSSTIEGQLGNQIGQTVSPSTTTTYTITVSDQCGSVDSAATIYTITSPPLVLTMSPGVEICPFEGVSVSVTATGGYGNYYYIWPQTGDTINQIFVNPGTTTTYNVIVSDDCQTFTVNGNTTITVVNPTADFIISSQTIFNDLPITFQNTTSNGDYYQWYFGDGNSSTLVHPNNTYDLPGTYQILLIATDEKGCIDSIQKPITIEEEYYVYVPNAFTPDGERFNTYFCISTIGVKSGEILIFNRWGELIFESKDLDFQWDGTYNGTLIQDGTFSWKFSYTTNSGRTKKITGHISILK